MIKMYEYPRCGTCRKAKKYLKDQGVSFDTQNIVEQPPTKEELKEMIETSGLPIRKFFNTSGKKYRELQLAKKMDELTDEEKLNLLASDGKLIKRPLVTDGKTVTVGFREEEYQKHWIQ